MGLTVETRRSVIKTAGQALQKGTAKAAAMHVNNLVAYLAACLVGEQTADCCAGCGLVRNCGLVVNSLSGGAGTGTVRCCSLAVRARARRRSPPVPPY